MRYATGYTCQHFEAKKDESIKMTDFSKLVLINQF